MKTKQDYIKYKLERADKSLKAAEILLKNNFPPDALGRIYYAAFYAISALLIERNLNPKTHKGVKALFHKGFVFTKQFDESFANLFDILFAKRFEVDYEDFPFIDEKSIPFQLEKTKRMNRFYQKKFTNK